MKTLLSAESYVFILNLVLSNHQIFHLDHLRDEFIFYSKRLIRLVIEYSLSLLPYESVTVSTPQGVKYEGKKCSVPMDHICGVVTFSCRKITFQPFLFEADLDNQILQIVPRENLTN